MSGISETVENFVAEQSGECSAENTAPLLPSEKHAVAAALTAERLRFLAEQMTLILRHAPRDAATFGRIRDEALTAWCEVDDHYQAFMAVLECKGQG